MFLLSLVCEESIPEFLRNVYRWEAELSPVFLAGAGLYPGPCTASAKKQEDKPSLRFVLLFQTALDDADHYIVEAGVVIFGDLVQLIDDALAQIDGFIT